MASSVARRSWLPTTKLPGSQSWRGYGAMSDLWCMNDFSIWMALLRPLSPFPLSLGLFSQVFRQPWVLLPKCVLFFTVQTFDSMIMKSWIKHTWKEAVRSIWSVDCEMANSRYLTAREPGPLWHATLGTAIQPNYYHQATDSVTHSINLRTPLLKFMVVYLASCIVRLRWVILIILVLMYIRRSTKMNFVSIIIYNSNQWNENSLGIYWGQYNTWCWSRRSEIPDL